MSPHRKKATHMENETETEQKPKTELDLLLEKNERMQDALLDLKDTISRMIGEGRLPNDDETRQWLEGIDSKLENERADRDVLLFNHGSMTTVVPPATERYRPDLTIRYQELASTINKTYASADRKYWLDRIQQAGL